MENLMQEINAQGKFQVEIVTIAHKGEITNRSRATIHKGGEEISYFDGTEKAIEAYLKRFLVAKKPSAEKPTSTLSLLSNRLRASRKELGLRLKDVASGVGISVPYLSDLERGRTNPSLATLQRLSNFYSEGFGFLQAQKETLVTVGGTEYSLVSGKPFRVSIGQQEVFVWKG